MKVFMDDEDARSGLLLKLCEPGTRPLLLLETSHIDDSLCQAGAT